MEEYITFISDNYIVFLIILLVIIFSVIGYLSDKKGFLKKIRHYILGKARNLIGTEKLYRVRHKE